MKIFMSHESHHKPLVREIKNSFPNHILGWIDENNILIGDNLSNVLEKAIKSDVDYVLLFISELAAKSKWVKQEVEWALKKERELSRVFVLPILIDDISLEEYFPEMSSRKYIKISNFSEGAIKHMANDISSELFALICRDLKRYHEPKLIKPTQAIEEAESLLTIIASLIRKAVFPHRQENPISISSLKELISHNSEIALSDLEFENILNLITQRNLIPGLSYDGYELYLIEEHSSWKNELNHKQKVMVARKASSLLKNDMYIYLDAGSTTKEIANIICKKVEMRSLSNISIATNSIEIANIITTCCVSMGFDDRFSSVKLYIPYGQVRTSTQAIVPIDNDQNILTNLSSVRDEFDVGFIGLNGAHIDSGITTHSNDEVGCKISALNLSKRKVFVCDDSKFGISLESKLADYDDDFTLIVNSNPSNTYLEEIKKIIPNKILFA
ncbi:MAG: TIR domain-containing protein [Defluviitaleaceae bacterium]|nr:TIR domain-containing protein [Defluviitaleaceae bacterium]